MIRHDDVIGIVSALLLCEVIFVRQGGQQLSEGQAATFWHHVVDEFF